MIHPISEDDLIAADGSSLSYFRSGPEHPDEPAGGEQEDFYSINAD
jgi:hypothetical protein